MQERLFRFKQFSVSHKHSSIPVGVDGVLAGAWAGKDFEPDYCRRMKKGLDVGTGCGVIALMLAQRFPEMDIDAIDVDSPSVDEASLNFKESRWGGRIHVSEKDFLGLDPDCKYDLIVSNPPFFKAGVSEFTTSRLCARHCASLSPEVLVRNCSRFLLPGGRLALICPGTDFTFLEKIARESGLGVAKACFVRDHVGSEEKRVLIEFGKPADADNCLDRSFEYSKAEHLTMFDSNGLPTDEYKGLTGAFYLKF